eukprot:3078303-Rhodomonas_salina.1
MIVCCSPATMCAAASVQVNGSPAARARGTRVCIPRYYSVVVPECRRTPRRVNHDAINVS